VRTPASADAPASDAEEEDSAPASVGVAFVLTQT
jgi:hypothetical protein